MENNLNNSKQLERRIRLLEDRVKKLSYIVVYLVAAFVIAVLVCGLAKQ
mgnify:CR=1 FL=1